MIIAFLYARNTITVMKALKHITCVLVFFIVILITVNVHSTVSGQCSDCHTMHNSQNGQSVAYQLNAGLDDFEASSTPNQYLLDSGCIGCHTSTGTSTIVNNVPIILNTSSVVNPLAGGNFTYVRSDDLTGHNVVGVKAQDGTLGLTPPGGSIMSSQLTCGGEYGCHGDRTAGNNPFEGLKGAHHTDDSGGITGSSVGLSYRFLNGILGNEDSNWEQDNTNTSHNEYRGSTSSATNTISSLCAQCHGNFHTWEGGASEVGTSSPWLRHPTDVILPTDTPDSEYESHTSYSMVTPVARPDSENVADTTAAYPGTDIVMCLSCHRSHASPYYKMVRWDYKNSTLSTAISGCSNCHTDKD